MARARYPLRRTCHDSSGGRPDYSGCRLLRNVWPSFVTLLGRVFPCWLKDYSVFGTLKVASVFDLISSSVTPGASSFKAMPPFFLSMSKTPQSVITMSTTFAPVRGSEHLCKSFGSTEPSFALAEC